MTQHMLSLLPAPFCPPSLPALETLLWEAFLGYLAGLGIPLVGSKAPHYFPQYYSGLSIVIAFITLWEMPKGPL